MDAPADDPRDDSIGDLFGRLADDGRAYLKAELDLYREVARHRAGRARNGLIALIAGAVLLLSALTALVIGLVFGLAPLTGPLLAGLIVAAALALIGFALVRFGLAGLRALSGDEGERQALARAETTP